MKIYKSISSSNQEMKNQNECLRRQLGEALKQKKKALESTTEFGQGDESKAESYAPK